MVMVRMRELPSSPSSSLSLSSSACCSNCLVTSPTPPASPSPSASFVPAAKSHTLVHACAGEHARARTHTHTHGERERERESKLFVVQSRLKKSASTEGSTWQGVCINSFHALGVNILKGICSMQHYDI